MFDCRLNELFFFSIFSFSSTSSYEYKINWKRYKKTKSFFICFSHFEMRLRKRILLDFQVKKMFYLFETKQTKKALKKELIKWTSRQKCGRKKRKCLIWREKLFRLHFGWEEDKQNAETIIIPSGYVEVQMKPLIICHFQFIPKNLAPRFMGHKFLDSSLITLFMQTSTFDLIKLRMQ